VSTTNHHPRDHSDPPCGEQHGENTRACAVGRRDLHGGGAGHSVLRRGGATRASAGIAGTVPSRRRGHGRWAFRGTGLRERLEGRQVVGEQGQRTQLLLQSRAAIPSRLEPLDSTMLAVAAPRALFGSGLRGLLQLGDDLARRIRRQKRGEGEPGGREPFETELVPVAILGDFTGLGKHAPVLLGEEVLPHVGQQAVNAGLPLGVGIGLQASSVRGLIGTAMQRNLPCYTDRQPPSSRSHNCKTTDCHRDPYIRTGYRCCRQCPRSRC
jgi:hypothetical protein